LAKLPVKAPANAPFDKIPSTPLDNVHMNGLPVNKENLPINDKTVQGVEGRLPINDKTVQGVEGHLPIDPKMIKLPVDVPPKVPGMRRSRHHVVREAGEKKNCGHLRVEASDNKFSGFVSDHRDANGRYTVVKNASQGTLVDLQGHNLIFRGEDLYPALGGTAGVVHDRDTPRDDLRGNSANFAMLTGTSTTLYGKAASTGRSSFNEATGAEQKIESAIYSFGENREIHASWINHDGSSIPATFGVNVDGQLILSANPGQYAATYGGHSAKLFCQ